MARDAEDGGRVGVQLFGRFALTVDGNARAVDGWRSRRAAELVQLLALQPGGGLLHEQVIDALWPHLDPEAGSANLRKAAHHARKSLGDARAVVLRGGRSLLFPGCAVQVDALAFEAAADAALQARRRDVAQCARAAALYVGELLPEARYEPWADAARERLRDKHLALLREAGDVERLFAHDPSDEAACQALMRRALQRGSRAAALRWYGLLRDHLQQVLKVRPGAATEGLYAQCLEGLQPVAATRLVGRSAELARAAAWLRAPAAERAGALVLRASAGMGKSTLCTRLADDARALGWRVHEVQASAASRPFGLVADLVEPLLLADRDGALLRAAGRHAHAVLAVLTPLAEPAAPLSLPLSRHQVVGALRRVLLAAAPPASPCLVVADDMHRADDGSAEVLLQLAASGPPMAVVLAYRPRQPTMLERGVERLQRAGRLEVIELAPLDDDAAATLVAGALPASATAAQVQRIVGAAQGHPFALLELARQAVAGRDAPAGSDAMAAIASHLCDGIDAPLLAALRGWAAAGEPWDVATATALAGGREAEAFAWLDQALAAELLVVVHGRYRFRHALLRQALLDAVPPHRRQALHRDTAQALASAGAEPGRVAEQWWAGDRADAALPLALQAAQRAFAVGAYNDVLRWVAPVLAQQPAEAEALRLRAESVDALGMPGALAAYDAAADAAADEAMAHELRAKRALAQVKMSDPPGALAYLKQVRPTTVAGRLAEALAYSGAAALGYGDPAVGTRKAAESRRLALQSGDKGSLVIASWAQAAAAHARGDLHGSVWADLQETSSLPELAVRVFDGHLCITQRFLYGARPYADVIDFADRLASEAQRLGAARGHAFAVTLRGEARLLNGQLDAAEADLLAGGRLHHAIGGATGEALSLQRRSELAMHRGQRALARALLDEALDVARQSDVGFHLLDRIYGTRIAIAPSTDAALAALEEADDAVRGPLETCPGCRITFAVPATIAAARGHELDLAAGHEQQAAYLANVVMRLPAWHAALSEAHGHVALARGERAAAASAFAKAAQGFQGAEQPLDEARCRQIHQGVG
jgi:DNA-binding SARP family transcriptional activator